MEERREMAVGKDSIKHGLLVGLVGWLGWVWVLGVRGVLRTWI